MSDPADRTPDAASPAQLRALFRRYGFRPRRSFGQTFLIDGNIARKIVSAAEIAPEDRVLEVGPGGGAVTQYLTCARRVVAVEIDPVLVEVLKETVGDRVEVICADVLTAPLEEILGEEPGPRWKVVTNLPYSITGPAIVRLLQARERIERMVIMVQMEVAERLVAAPGSRQRGWLTVLVETLTEARLVGRVSRNCFWPRPKVDSAILALTVRHPSPISRAEEARLTRVLKAAFGTRRKLVVNALAQGSELGLTRESARALLEQCGVEPGLRAEALAAEDFLRLARAVGERAEG